jgi:hypothetical protein
MIVLEPSSRPAPPRKLRVRRARERRRPRGLEMRRLAAPGAAAVTDATIRAPLATLVTGQVVQDGEIIHFIIKPSRWYMVLSSLLFIATVTLIVGGMQLLHWPMLLSTAGSLQLLIFLAGARLMWAALQWMGRYYILTDLRVIRLSGVFEVEILSCPLRKVKNVRRFASIAERIFGKGSLEVTADSDCKLMYWSTISRPDKIYEQVAVAVQRAQQNGCGQA